MLLIGPTALILGGTLENFGYYVANLITTSTNLFTYEDTEWLGGWTIFYWGWWIVGRLCRHLHRTHFAWSHHSRVFDWCDGGADLICSALDECFWWRRYRIDSCGGSGIWRGRCQRSAAGLFLFLDYLPGTFYLSLLSLVMIVIFFVTSADSGALVLNMMASGGVDETPVFQRVLWRELSPRSRLRF